MCAKKRLKVGVLAKVFFRKTPLTVTKHGEVSGRACNVIFDF